MPQIAETHKITDGLNGRVVMGVMVFPVRLERTGAHLTFISLTLTAPMVGLVSV